MKQLQHTFTKRGKVYTCLHSSPRGFIYEVFDDPVTYYEVFMHKTSKPHPMAKHGHDMVVLYPSDESFGKWAWCYRDMDIAMDRFRGL